MHPAFKKCGTILSIASGTAYQPFIFSILLHGSEAVAKLPNSEFVSLERKIIGHLLLGVKTKIDIEFVNSRQHQCEPQAGVTQQCTQ